MNIGIIVAEEEEMLALKNLMQDIREEKVYNLNFIIGSVSSKTCILVKCGVGKVNAARTTQILIDKYAVNAVINIGSAGGVNEKLNINDIVISKKLVQYDFDITKVGNYEKGEICEIGKYIEADKQLINLCKNAVDSKEYQTKIGVIASADMFCADTKIVEKVREDFNAECVEMEGAAVAQVCFLDNIPFLVIRGISDTPNGINGIDFHTHLKIVSERVAKILEKMLK